MIAEELKVKISVDTSEVSSGVESAKKQLNSLGDSEGTTKLKSGLGQSAEAAEQLHDQLAGIRGMSFAGLLAGVSNLSEQFATFKNTKQDFKEMADYAKKFLDQTSEIYTGPDAILDWEGEAEALKNYNAHMNEANSLMGESTGIFGMMAQKAGAAGVSVGALVASIAALAAEIFIVVGLTRNALNVSKQIKEINSEAKKIGLSTQGYQEWVYVLEQCGVEADKLSDFVKTLTEEQIAARGGSEDIIKSFQALGMTMEEVSAMGQEELFTKTVEGLQNIADEGYRTHLAYTLLGEDAAQLNNVLYLSNAETSRLIANYNLLGGVATPTLVERSNTLQASLSNMRGAWQGIKNTLAEAVLPAVIAVVNWLTRAIAIVNLFFKAVLGVEISPGKTSTGGYMGGMTTGVNNYTNAANTATKAAEKLRRSVMGFDELNVLNAPTSSSGSDGGDAGSNTPAYSGGGGGGIGGINADDLDLSGITAWFEKYKKVIQDITTWSLIGIGVVGAVLCFMGGNWIGGLAFLGMAGIGIAVGSVEGGTFDRLGQKIKSWWESFKGWFNSKVKPVFTKEFWVKLWENLKTAASDKLAEIKKKVEEKMKPIKDWFEAKVKPIFTKKYWADLWEQIKAAASEKLVELKKKIDEKMEALKEWFEEDVKPIFTKKYWQDKFDTMRQGASDKLGLLKTKIDEKLKPLKNWFNNTVKPIFTKKYWQDKFNTIKSGAADKLDAAKTTIQTKWTGIKNWFNTSVKPKFTTKYWSDKFNTIKNGAKAAFNGIISVVETAINRIIAKINTLSWKIPDWVPKLGGKTFGFNFKSIAIPRLATGGIATSSVLANIGENGREAVLPLENNTGWMDVLADKIAARNGQAPSKIVLQVGEKELGWATIRSINQITQQTGGLQLKL